MADLVAMDLVPEPTILAAALRACRRVNDFSLTTRILEITKIKCGDKEAEFWPYIMQVGQLCVYYIAFHIVTEKSNLGAETHHGRARHPKLGGDGLQPARVGPP